MSMYKRDIPNKNILDLPEIKQSIDFMHQITNDIFNDLQKQKEQLIKDALYQNGIVLTEEDKTRRFKLLNKEVVNYGENWYYNDGSIDGKRIITFMDEQPNIDLNRDEYNYKITHSFKYKIWLY